MTFQPRLVRLLCFMFLFLANAAFAGARIYTGLFSSTAVSGYDVVSFYAEKPIKGAKQFKFEYAEATWLFSSAKNLAAFKADPEKFVPQYGGHCAWAVAVNKARAPGNPDNWTIVDGKLYLNYNKKVQEKWLIDIPGFISAGDLNWPSLLND